MVNKTRKKGNVFIGIDISKDWFDVAIGKSRLKAASKNMALQKCERYANSAEGWKSMIVALGRSKVALIALEATGGYERGLQKALEKAGYPVLRAHPNRVHAFAKFEGRLAKTDTIDAAILMAYAAQTNHQPKPINQVAEKLRDWQARRQQLQGMLHAEQCRKGLATDSWLKKILDANITNLKSQINEVDERMDAFIEKSEELREKRKLLRTLKGVGNRTANAILAALPEIGVIDNKKIAALVGVAPINRDSGKKTGHAYISGGRSMVRHPLYMAAVCAARCNPLMKAFYEKLMAAHKPPKLALTAIMRRMIVILNAIIRTGEPWKGAIPA